MSDESVKKSARQVVAVVDDDAVCRRLVEFAILRGGYDVKSFGSAEEFLADRGTEGYACIVLDMSMPGQSGFDVQSALNDRGTPTPVLFLTAEADPITAAAALRNGAADMISKPVDPETLLEKLHDVMSSSRRAA